MDRLRRKVADLPCAMLLFAQLGALLAYPFIETRAGDVRETGRAIFGLIGLLVLFLAVRAVRATPALTWVAAVLGGPVVLLTIAEAVWPANDVDRLLERPAARRSSTSTRATGCCGTCSPTTG